MVSTDRIADTFICKYRPEFLISYGYRYILPTTILNHFLMRAINLHISFLPWNRGADPNFWSFYDDTPKGISIHHLDKGVDTGNILLQREVVMSEDDSLRTSYDRLQESVQQLFKETWSPLLSRTPDSGKCQMPGSGTFHRSMDLQPLRHLLRCGWDTPVIEIRHAGEEARLQRQDEC